MITVRVKIIAYNKITNTCTAQLLNGDIIALDPFVGCAIPMTEEEYERGVGFYLVGNSYLLVEYMVYKDLVVPSENGMIAV